MAPRTLWLGAASPSLCSQALGQENTGDSREEDDFTGSSSFVHRTADCCTYSRAQFRTCGSHLYAGRLYSLQLVVSYRPMPISMSLTLLVLLAWLQQHSSNAQQPYTSRYQAAGIRNPHHTHTNLFSIGRCGVWCF